MTHKPKAPSDPAPLRVAALALDSIQVEGQQIRNSDDEEALRELADDIKRRGLLQPIGVAPLAAGRYQLLYGSRRLRAHYLNGASHIQAVIRSDDAAVKGTALAENIHRRQLTLPEEIQTVLELHHQEHLSPEQIATVTGKSREWILRRLAVPQLLPELARAVLAEELPLGAAEELHRIKDEPTRQWAFAQALAGRISVADLKATRKACDDADAHDPGTEAAIAAGIHAAQTARISYRCEACGATREHNQLRVVRICVDPCPTTNTDPASTH